MTRENSTTITLLIVLTALIQVVFIFADTKDAPHRAVTRFAERYFQMDPQMSQLLCEKLASDETENVVQTYLQMAAAQASERGYSPAFMKKKLYDVRTETLQADSKSAVVRITAELKRGINPVFSYVGKIFFLGETVPFERTAQVVYEGGKWKVCGGFFNPVDIG